MTKTKSQKKTKALFSNSEAVEFAWAQTRKNFLLLLGIMITMGVVEVLKRTPDIIKWMVPDLGHGIIFAFLLFIFVLGGTALSFVLYLGLIGIALNIARGKKVEYVDLFNSHGKFWAYLGGSILYGLIIVVGLILLIVPGIIWSIQFSMWPYLVVDKKLGPVQALKMSAQMTDGSKTKLVFWGLRLMGVVLLGLVCLLVGLIPAVMVCWIGEAYIYTKLLKKKGLKVVKPA